ncbi:hypothetical protein [Pseudomonas sp. H2_D02]
MPGGGVVDLGGNRRGAGLEKPRQSEPHRDAAGEEQARIFPRQARPVVQQLFGTLVAQLAGQAAHAIGHVRQVMGHAKRVVGFEFRHGGLGAARQRIDLVRRGIAVLAEMRIGPFAGAADGFVHVILDVMQRLFWSPMA